MAPGRIALLGLIAWASACGPHLPPGALVAQLDAPDPEAREEAADGLRDGPMPAEAEAALLAAVAREKAPDALCAMLHALGATGTQRALDVLEERLHGPPAWDTIRCVQKGMAAWTRRTGRDAGAAMQARKVAQAQAQAAVEAERVDPLRQILRDAPRPGLFGPLTAITFGMDEDDVAVVAPAFESLRTEVGEVDYRLDADEGRIWRARVDFGAVDIGAALAPHWGPPEEVKGGGQGKTVAWFNRDAGLRFLHERHSGTSTLDVEAYWPLADLAAGGALGEPLRALFALDMAAAKKRFSDRIDAEGEDELVLDLPPTDFDRHFTRVRIRYEGARPASIRFRIDCALAPGCFERVLPVLEAAYGPPTRDDDARIYRGGDHRVTASVHGGQLALEVRP